MKDAGIPVKKSSIVYKNAVGWLSWLFGPAVMYLKESKCIYEGDEVTLFGKVTYNIKDDAITLNEPLAMYWGASVKEIYD